jgi:hypothetical protein
MKNDLIILYFFHVGDAKEGSETKVENPLNH